MGIQRSKKLQIVQDEVKRIIKVKDLEKKADGGISGKGHLIIF
jgi:hypothetical protein